MNLIRLQWQNIANINVNTEPFCQNVLGDVKSVFNLWFILKENKDIINLQVYSLEGIEIDMTKGMAYINSFITQ